MGPGTRSVNRVLARGTASQRALGFLNIVSMLGGEGQFGVVIP